MTENGTTAEYIKGLLNNTQELADNLNAMGVSASASEKFDGLIPKVLSISRRVGIVSDTWIPVGNSTEYTIENISFLPAKIAMACDDVLNSGDSMVVQGKNLVAIFNVDFPMNATQIIELNENGKVVIESFDSNVLVTVEKQDDELYKITLSLEELNTVSAIPYCFKGGYEHVWVITDEGWFAE